MNPLDFWTSKEFEISSYKFKLEERKNQTHTVSGGDVTGLCSYTYNELGFRGDSITKEGFKVMSIGCSVTEGVGVNGDQTWPHQFTKLIKNGVNLNFGTSGRSNDFISRCLLSYYDLIKPDLVLIMYTFPYRREIYTPDDGIEPYITGNSWGYLKDEIDGVFRQECLDLIQTNAEDIINWYKNHLLIKNFLENKKCNWVWNGSLLIRNRLSVKNYIDDNQIINLYEKNRFDGDYNYLIDSAVDKKHPGPYHNNRYAFNLYKFIKTNFPSYLPSQENVNNKKLY